VKKKVLQQPMYMGGANKNRVQLVCSVQKAPIMVNLFLTYNPFSNYPPNFKKYNNDEKRFVTIIRNSVDK
jgi:hypothetical protein